MSVIHAPMFSGDVLPTGLALYGWGYNGEGELALGDWTQRNSPTRIGADLWLSVSAGAGHGAGIKSDNTVWTWGQNLHGALGLADTVDRNTMTQVTAFSSVFATNFCTFGIANDKKLSGTGRNYSYELGIDDALNKSVFTLIDSGEWETIGRAGNGAGSTLALKADNTLWVTGTLSGVGTYSNFTQIGTTTWNSVASSFDFFAAIKTDGTLWTCGDNFYGQLGLGDKTDRSSLTQVGSDTWSMIDCGGRHMVGIKTDGTLWTWGDNDYRQLGNPSWDSNWDRTTPWQLGTDTYIWCAAGRDHTLAIKTNGTLWAWGRGSSGQLGIGTTPSGQATPTQVGGDVWQKVYAGVAFSLGLRAT